MHTYCQQKHGLGNIKAIESLQECKAFLNWQADGCSGHKSQHQIMRTACNHATILAQFHGFIYNNFKWEDSVHAHHVRRAAAERAHALAKDTHGRTVNQQNATLSANQMPCADGQ